MKYRILGVLCIIGILVAGLAYAINSTKSRISPEKTDKNSLQTVILTANGFQPTTLIIKTGMKVTWENRSGTDATVDSNPHPIHTDYPPLNLGSFSDGGKLTLLFNKSGKYGYHNHFNPNQRGEVIVQ